MICFFFSFVIYLDIRYLIVLRVIYIVLTYYIVSESDGIYYQATML